MNKEKIKKFKIIYYPCKAVKKLIHGGIGYTHYLCSLIYIYKNKKAVKKKIDNSDKINVVFIVQYIPGWNKLEPIFSKMQQDSRFNPKILCVPMNIQENNLVGTKENDTWQYFVDNGYEVVNAINKDGTWYDLKKLRPDYVFHSRPYNSFMPKCYKSGLIRKYTLICNVLYGLNLTKNVQPVLLNKDYFRDCFCYYALDDGEKEYYNNRFKLGINCGIQHCFTYGGIGIGQLISSETPRKKIGYRKVIIWTPRWSTDEKIGGSNFFNYKDVMLDLASKHKDCLFIFRPHPLMFSNFIKTGEMSYDDVDNFKKLCKGNITLDESKEYFNTFWQSDLLITDGSAIVPEYFATGKPIMFCQTKISEYNTEFYNDVISRCYEVFNKDDLYRYFNKLIEGDDEKEVVRKKFIESKMKKYTTSSQKIIDSLLTWR